MKVLTSEITTGIFLVKNAGKAVSSTVKMALAKYLAELIL